MKINSLSRETRRGECRASSILLGCLVAIIGAGASATARPSSTKQQVEALVVKLEFKAGEKERADACRELARIGTEEAVAPLATLLSDESLSHMARYGLETIPSSAVDRAFRDALGKLHGRLLVGVIGSIGVRKDEKAVKPLAGLLQDSDSEVAQAAARALGKIGSASAARALQKALPGASPTNQLAFCEGLFRCAEALDRDGNQKQAIAIYDQMRSMHTPLQVSEAALRGAILARSEKGWALLVESAQSQDFAVFQIAMRISAEMPEAEVTRLLAAELAKLPVDNQVLLTQTLGRRSDPAALPALFAATRSGPKLVRLAAVRAVAEIGDTSAVPVFVALLGDSDAEISHVTQESLASLHGVEVDNAVMTMLSNPDVNRRFIAMELAVRRRMTSAIPKLTAAAGDLDVKIRVFAVRRLGELAGPGQLPSLLRLLDRATTPQDLEATEQALTAVSLRVPDADACAAQVTDYFPKVRSPQQCALLRVLTAVGGARALETVRAAVDNTDPDIRTTALRCLSSWNSVDVAPHLLALLKKGAGPSDTVLLMRGYLRLAALPDLPAEKRLALCREAAGLVQHRDEKRLLLGALAGIQSPESLALIAPYLDDADTREEAATATVNISETLIQGSNAGKVAPKLAEYLEKVKLVTDNDRLHKRAQSLLDLAQTKGAAK